MLILLRQHYLPIKGKICSLKMAEGNIDASAAIADVDRDGYSDIVVGSTMVAVIAFDGNGRNIWGIDLEDQISFAPDVRGMLE